MVLVFVLEFLNEFLLVAMVMVVFVLEIGYMVKRVNYALKLWSFLGPLMRSSSSSPMQRRGPSPCPELLTYTPGEPG